MNLFEFMHNHIQFSGFVVLLIALVTDSALTNYFKSKKSKPKPKH